MKRFSKTLLKYCKSKEEEDRLRIELQDKPLSLKILVSLLQEQLTIKEKERLKNKYYDSTGWGYRQADYNGEIRILNFLLDMFK